VTGTGLIILAVCVIIFDSHNPVNQNFLSGNMGKMGKGDAGKASPSQ